MFFLFRPLDWADCLVILLIMKAIWMILSLVFGLLFFWIGCAIPKVEVIEYLGAIVLFPGLIGLCDALWPEKEGAE